MTKSITDVFDISAENPEEAGSILSVAGVRSRTPLYAAETRNIERRIAYIARRGGSTAVLTNRLAMVSMQNSAIEGEVTKLRFFAEGSEGKAAIYGQVTVNGVGAEGLVVAAYDLKGKAIEPAVRTDATGTFVLVVEPPQKVRIVVSTGELKVLKCLDAVFDLIEQPKYDVNIALDTTQPVPIDPEYPCEMPQGPDGGGGGEPQPTLVEVPDLIGLTLEEASDKLLGVALSGDFSTRPDPGKDGIVIEQGVPAGHKVPEGTAIAVVIAERELPLVPEVVGKRARDAAVIIKQAGFDPAIVAADGGEKPGIVFDQFPAAGTPAVPGSRVGALVAREKLEETVEVPSVVAKPLKDASVILRDAGLQVGALTEVPVREGPAGIVKEQQPEAGTTVSRGSAVDLTVTRLEQVRMTMPKVTGTAAQSIRALSVGNWADVRVRFSGDPASQMQVIEQKPAEGEEVFGTEVVTLAVRPQTAWKTEPQRGVAQLFEFSPDWMRSGATAADTRKVAQGIASVAMDDLRRMMAAGPDAMAEQLSLANRALAEPLHEAVIFGVRTMAQLP